MLGPPRPRPSSQARATARTLRTALTLDSLLLGRVLLRPELAALVPRALVAAPTPESRALRAVLDHLHEDASRNLGQLSEYFRGSEHEAAIGTALAEPLLNQASSPDLDLEAEVRALAEKLRSEGMARRALELSRIMESGTATDAQRDEYHRLFASMSAAKSGSPPSGERSP